MSETTSTALQVALPIAKNDAQRAALTRADADGVLHAALEQGTSLAAQYDAKALQSQLGPSPSPRAGLHDATPQAVLPAAGPIANRLAAVKADAAAKAHTRYLELLRGGQAAFDELPIPELTQLLADAGDVNPDRDLAMISRVRAAELADGEISRSALDRLKTAERAALAGVKAAEKSLDDARTAYTAAQSQTRRVEWKVEKLQDELRDIRRQMPGYLSQII
jgi:hypothetical protein